MPAPRPAFEHSRLQFDRNDEPVVLGKRLLVGSSQSDHVKAYDTETGQQLWRFYTQGPVRLAPVAWRDRVYFGSDDGHLVCLDAAEGTLNEPVYQDVYTGRILTGDEVSAADARFPAFDARALPHCFCHQFFCQIVLVDAQTVGPSR